MIINRMPLATLLTNPCARSTCLLQPRRGDHLLPRPPLRRHRGREKTSRAPQQKMMVASKTRVEEEAEELGDHAP